MKSTGATTIDFSAQFGGRDAAAVVLPHFRALKTAAKGITLSSFPYPQLAFILRVDGEVNRYGLSGAGKPDVDNENKYLSVDIGISEKDRDDISTRITSSILDSLPIIAAAVGDNRTCGLDVTRLRASLALLCERYRETLIPK